MAAGPGTMAAVGGSTAAARAAYVLALDRFTLRHLYGRPALREPSVPRHREGEPARLCPTLDGRAPSAHRVRYVVSDHHGHRVAPGKQDGDAPPPHGYRLGRRTRMTVDVHNFDDTAHSVTVSARPVGGGWTVRTDQGRRETRIRVPAGGRAGDNFTVLAGSSVPRRTDRRLAFRATADDHAGVPASVALIHRG